MNYFNKDGHLNDLGISLYADAVKLNKVSDLPESFKHLSDCEECQHQVIDFTAIMVDVDQTQTGAHPYFDKKETTFQSVSADKTEQKKGGGKVRSLLYRLAVAAAIGALIFFLARQFNETSTPGIVDAPKTNIDNKEQPYEEEVIKEEESPLVKNKTPEEKEPKIEKPNSTPSKDELPEIKEDNRVLFAANYETNEDFESMLESTFRSGDFKVNLPENDAVFKSGSKILFSWENNITLNLTILDNQEEELIKQELTGLSFDFQSDLKPGIYYWKLETEDDLLHLGKFIID